MMDGGTIDLVLSVLGNSPIGTLDITGGAPELNPGFRSLIVDARRAGKRVIVRTNLTIFFEPGMENLAEFYQEQGVELIASLPCYLEQNVDFIRGSGAYQKSIEALRKLNSLGFGMAGPDARLLGLVYNPGGAFLPPLQSLLEADYKRELQARHGISFTRLYTFTNMAIGRFRDALQRAGQLTGYTAMLVSAFNPAALDKIMCRTLLSVGWDGRLYDCDFNQIIGIPVTVAGKRHIRDFDYATLSRRPIAVDDHCYGCTAGQGST
jgi:radical SAM/Cys-rich protein